jgi:LacI family transcriptional regulator, galactose operon repressor
MDPKIAVASLTLGTGFPGHLYGLMKKHLRPGHAFIECSMVLQKTPEHVQARLRGLLQVEPRPTALVGICIRPDPVTLAAYRAAGIPVVLIDEEVEGASTIASDGLAGGLLAARHLLRAGRRSPGVVSGIMHLDGGYNAQQRVKGFIRGLAEGGLTLPPEHLVEVMNYSRMDGMEAMAKLLDARRSLDAIFCAAGDVCATGILATARARGVAVPRQLALVGYDDNPVAAASDPPLTTLRQPLEQIAREAYRFAADETAAILAKPRKVLLAPELVVRSST